MSQKQIEYKQEDVPSIEKFFKKIVKGQSSMYEGEWKFSNEEDLTNPHGILKKAFGDVEGDEYGGKVRSFLNRQNTSGGTNLFDLFGHDNKEKDKTDEEAGAAKPL